MCDALFIFVPQWSPFQPALSLPSLSAWLKRAGFDVHSLDLNLLFYEWLFSDDCASILLDCVARSDRTASQKLGYRAIFASASAFRADLRRLREPPASSESGEDFSVRTYLAVQGFETYLDAISAVVGDFFISPYEFRLTGGNLDGKEVARRLHRPPSVIDAFVRKVVCEQLLPVKPSMFGLSCIGQEQLYFTLLLGRRLKEFSEAPVVVGGTILTRIFERGALKTEWFSEYFDVIVRNEGERPGEALLTNLRSGEPLTRNVPGIVHCEAGGVEATRPAPPLRPAELPVPDFDDMPLGRYVSPEITLPLLTARGCYWGKCEFCHHGMVYGEKYAPYKPLDVLDTVTLLSERYGVRRFAFNDEAIPPKVLRAIGERFPSHRETGWTFTGLIKFEPTYKQEDFEGFYAAGGRSLYVGLESASERVLGLMKKRSARSTIVGNLTDATCAGIWMHCFLFFGFPGETDADAQETVDFIVAHQDVISSYGAGTFSLEHNSPIFHHFSDYGVRLRPSGVDDLSVYYDYEVEEGLSRERALEWLDELHRATKDLSHYRAASWVPRELLLCMLSTMTADELLRSGPTVRECNGLPGGAEVNGFVTCAASQPGRHTTMVINRVNGRTLGVPGSDGESAALCFGSGLTVAELQELAPRLFSALSDFEQEPATSDGWIARRESESLAPRGEGPAPNPAVATLVPAPPEQ